MPANSNCIELNSLAQLNYRLEILPLHCAISDCISCAR